MLYRQQWGVWIHEASVELLSFPLLPKAIVRCIVGSVMFGVATCLRCHDARIRFSFVRQKLFFLHHLLMFCNFAGVSRLISGVVWIKSKTSVSHCVSLGEWIFVARGIVDIYEDGNRFRLNCCDFGDMIRYCCCDDHSFELLAFWNSFETGNATKNGSDYTWEWSWK